MEELTILADGQAIPEGVKKPERKASWFDTFSYIANPEQFCRQNLDKYGAIFNTGVFGTNTVFVGSSQAIQMAFNGDSKYTEIALPETTMDMFGEYSLFQRSDLHRERKSALRPGFTGSMLAGYMPHINQTIVSSIETWNEGNKFLYPVVEEICFKVLVPILLGIPLTGDRSNVFAASPFANLEELKSCYRTYFNGFYGLLKWNSSLTAYGRGIKARAKLLKFMQAIIQQRRTSSTAIDPQADFLSMMLASQQENPDGVFSDALIENQCLLQLWASHYEISGLVASLIYQLGKYPQVLAKLLEEQDRLTAEQTNSGVFVGEQLKQMSFLEATIKESLRTLPPSSTVNRRLTKSVILDGILYPKGYALIAEPRLAHMMSEYFAEPQLFDPERFLPPRSEGKMYQFIPFGGGIHACLGAQMAMVTAKIFVSHWISRFDWQLIGEPSFVQFPLKRIKSNYQIDLKKKIK